MSFYLWVSFVILALVAYDLVRGKILSVVSMLSLRPSTTRIDNPRLFWSSIAWRAGCAVLLIVMEVLHLP
jgi:hypothetical protein